MVIYIYIYMCVCVCVCGLITRMVPTLVGVYQFGTRGMPRITLWFFFFVIFLQNFFVTMCQVPVVTRGNVSATW